MIRRRATTSWFSLLSTAFAIFAGIAIAAPPAASASVSRPLATVPSAPAAAAASAAGDAFYIPPSPLPGGRPGDVIRYRKGPDVAGADAYTVLYLSRSALDKPIAVSGTVLVPQHRDRATMPIVGVGVGTVGLGDQCAASKTPLVISLQAGDSLRKGWALAATDYEGMGTPGPHTYIVGRSEGHAVIDAVRAAQRLRVTGLGARNPVAFWGYSQGGGAVAWAGELQPRYAPELELKGIAAGGVPADLLQVAAPLGGLPAFGIVAMAAYGFDAAYPELDLDSYLNPLGRKLLAFAEGQCVALAAGSMAGLAITTLTTRNPLADPAWIARLNENKLGSHPPEVPIELYHGVPYDEAVAYPQAHALMRTYCAAGADVTWHTYIGEHIVAALAGMSDAQRFLQDRFDGRPATSTC